MLLIALAILFRTVLSQDKVSFQFATYTTSSSSLMPEAVSTAISNQTDALSNITSPITQVSSECTPGVLIGTFEFQVPNSTSIFTSGSRVNISWGFSQYVTIIPNVVDIKYASLSNSKNNQWTTIASVNGSQNFYVWTIPQGSATDQFIVRLVPDNKETAYKLGYAGQAPCFGDGMVTPSSSNPFKIVTNIPLITSPDAYGPRSMGYSLIVSYLLIITILLR